ncbi:MAG TPA: PAS domain S-box protein [Gammaproteobacteria bacterium]|nr:PAS domain S-box protein [Gammaproteobacteria bacterium]
MEEAGFEGKLRTVLQEVAFELSATDGEQFLRQCVDHLVQTFGTAYGFVGRLYHNEAGIPSIRALAAMAHGNLIEPFQYTLPGTPCENVVGKKICAYGSHCQELFPNDPMLVDMGVQSYIGAPLFDSAGQPTGIVVVLHTEPIEDLDYKKEVLKIYALRVAREIERQESEREVRRSEERYRTLVANIPGVVYRCRFDAERSMAFISEAIQTLSGYPPEDFIDNRVRSYASLIHPQDAPVVEDSVRAAIRENRSFVLEYRLVDAQGRIHWVYEKGQAHRDQHGDVVWLDGALFDISDKKQVENELRSYQVHLEQIVEQRTADMQNAIAELEAFSYSVSHDLRAPLRGIDGFSEALLQDCVGQLDEQGRDYLARIRAASQRMGALIDDLLTLSRIGRKELKREVVDLSALARTVFERLQKDEPQRVVDIRVEDGLRLEGDASLMTIVLENLLGNAWKYSGRKTDACIEMGSTTVDDRAVFFVRDNGDGFDMEYADKLFGVFERLHGGDFEGTGIGLATVKRIIERHGGRIWGEGKPQQGACFYFSLPGGN